MVDAETEQSLYSVLTIYEILELGVQQVTLITDNNTSSSTSNLQAIYLLLPTPENIDLILRDYAPPVNQNTIVPPPTSSSSKDKKKHAAAAKESNSSSRHRGPPRYSAAHVHFIDRGLSFNVDFARDRSLTLNDRAYRFIR